MSNHPEDISPEEEQAARLTAFVLGELSGVERLEVESQLNDAEQAECERLEQLVAAVAASEQADSYPKPSAKLRDTIELKLSSDEGKVELSQANQGNSRHGRFWFVCTTGLSLLLVAIAVSAFVGPNLSKSIEHKIQIAELRQTNAKLRTETEAADARLALEQTTRRFTSAQLASRTEQLAAKLTQLHDEQANSDNAAVDQQLATNIQLLDALGSEVSDLREKIRTTQHAKDSKFAAVTPTGVKPPGQQPIVSSVQTTPLNTVAATPQVVTVDASGAVTAQTVQPHYTLPDPNHLATKEYDIRGSWAYRPADGKPPANLIAAGPNAKGAGTAIINYGRSAQRQPTKKLVQTYRRRGGTVEESRSKRIDELQSRLYSTRFALGLVDESQSSEQYSAIVENRFQSPNDEPLSTFSIDVDTASYANTRRYLNQNQLPPTNAVRIEELVNYFSYDYADPTDDKPFSVDIEVAECPWQTEHQLVRIGLKGKDVPQKERPASNIVFLLDVSGSMQDANKLPLLKQAMKLLTAQLTESDRVSIVTYAGNAGLALDTTNGENEQSIRDAIDALNANGSTNGSAGIQLAYEKATESFIKDGANRVILATDGDLNVGVTSDDALVELIKEKAGTGVFLTVLGFGEGNLKDGKLEKLADNGNGMYAYIDSLREARKVLVEQIAGSLVTIAKDVKIKVEFNPAEVSSYRLLGYGNRLMSAPDFDNDAKDAGEIGAGHTVTALYEIVPTSAPKPKSGTNTSLKYQKTSAPEEEPSELTDAASTGELLTLFLRYKLPDASESTLTEFAVKNKHQGFDEASNDFRFAASVASFGMLLRNSEYRGQASYAQIEEIASASIGNDSRGHRTEFLDLVRKANTLQPRR